VEKLGSRQPQRKEVDMRVPPLAKPEVADIMIYGVEKLTVRGVGRRAAIRRIARKHGARPRSVAAMIASDDGAREARL
jgi:hypothetical protein